MYIYYIYYTYIVEIRCNEIMWLIILIVICICVDSVQTLFFNVIDITAGRQTSILYVGWTLDTFAATLNICRLFPLQSEDRRLSIHIYQTKGCNIPEDSNLNLQHMFCGNINKIQMISTYWKLYISVYKCTLVQSETCFVTLRQSYTQNLHVHEIANLLSSRKDVRRINASVNL